MADGPLMFSYTRSEAFLWWHLFSCSSLARIVTNVKTVFAENRYKLEESAEVYTKAINATASENINYRPQRLRRKC